MEGLFQAIRERKLDRVAAAYAVVAWLAVQAASIALPAFDSPPWLLRWLIVVAIVGFPAALLFAWVNAAPPEESARNPRTRIRDWSLVGISGAILGASLLQLAFHWSAMSDANIARMQTAAADKAQAHHASIAVLPFVNLSGDPAKTYLSDGIADQLINELSRKPKMRVAARTSSFALAAKNADIKSIAKALNVAAIVEGSVREDGNRVRVAAELISAVDGFPLWSATYDRNLTDMLALQDEIAGAITEALSQRLLGHHAEPVRKPTPRKPINPEAYKAYLQGQYYFAQRTKDGIARAITQFEKVNTLEPKYADGYAALAMAHVTRAMNFMQSEEMAPANLALRQALEIDPRNETALIAHATLSVLQWKWRAAADDIRRLETYGVHSAALWHMRAIFFSYMALSKLAMESSQHAVEIDPLSYIDRYNVAIAQMNLRDYRAAEVTIREALAVQPANVEARQALCQVQAARKDFKAAATTRDMLKVQAGTDEDPTVIACNYFINLSQKNYAEIRKIADMVAGAFPAVDINASDIGSAYASAGDFDKAIVWYEKAYALREPWMLPVAYNSPEQVDFFKDPRWKALRQKPEIRAWDRERLEIQREFTLGE